MCASTQCHLSDLFGLSRFAKGHAVQMFGSSDPGVEVFADGGIMPKDSEE